MPAAIVESAAAKINLFLHVTGRRADGYHTLESLVAFTEFGDRLEFYPADEITLEMKGAFAAPLAALPLHENLVIKAAAALQRRAGCGYGARIVLNKQIPLAAGLGGGSADAAAALRGLSRLWRLGLSNEELMKLAAELGSDVPVCLMSRSAMMRGVGEMLQPISLESHCGVILANPGLELPTAGVFRKFSGEFSAPQEMLKEISSFNKILEVIALRRNDLEAAAVSLQPAIAETLEALRRLPGCALSRMTGSGATCFALFDSENIDAAAQALVKKYPDWWVTATTFM